MALLDKLFTSFRSAFSKGSAVEAKAVSKAVAPKGASKIIQKTSVTKPASVNTATKIYTESSGKSILKDQAKSIAGSSVVRTAGKAAAGSVIIGGAVYGLGALTSKGMQNVGYGWRDLTNSHTPQETTRQDLDNRSKSQELDQEAANQLKDFYKWANANGYSDSPSVREAYDNYVKGQGSETQDQTQGKSGIDPWIIGAGALAAAAGIYFIVKNKKKGSKK